MAFRKATKKQAKLRAAIYGPSGAGKTFTALRVASGMGGKIAVIDTERGSAEKYADRFEFDVCNPDSLTIDGYLAAFREAAREGYTVLIVDSLSHAWQELLAEIDKLAAAKYRGNTWSAWSEGTPKQRKLVDAILAYPGHVIATMRADTEWAQEQDGRGKVKPVKIGLKPQQGKGIEYEFDLLIGINLDHLATVEKDRTGKFQDSMIEKPGEDFGRELAAWLSDGEAAPQRPAQRPQPARNQAGADAEPADPHRRGDDHDPQQWFAPPPEVAEAVGRGEYLPWWIQAWKACRHIGGARTAGQTRALIAYLVPDEPIDPADVVQDAALACRLWGVLKDMHDGGTPLVRIVGDAIRAAANSEAEAETATA